MSCRLTILASGSTGNCAYLETDTTRILIDAGLSARQIEERLASIDRSAAQLQAILITHEHSDHIAGVRVLASRFQIPVYANRNTRDATIESFSSGNAGQPAKPASINWRIFETGQRFAAGDFDVEPFSIPHDACDPVGFLVHHADRTVAFMTDMGHVTQLVLDKARQADTILLETNYDVKMLQNDPNRPWLLKQRISGRHGHLSNDDAAAAVGELMSDRIRHLFLCHLSQECNKPTIAEDTIRKKLKEIGASQVRVTVTHPVTPCATDTLSPARPLRVENLQLFAQPGVIQA